MRTLYLLDLDHTIIYGSYAPSEDTELLFSYSNYLKVYNRPFVREFIKELNSLNKDIIVFTTAKKDYAHQICRLLKINTIDILSRKDCENKKDKYYKKFLPIWGEIYYRVFIIDDSPNVWLNTEKYKDKITFIVPNEFRGESNDKELLKYIGELSENRG